MNRRFQNSWEFAAALPKLAAGTTLGFWLVAALALVSIATTVAAFYFQARDDWRAEVAAIEHHSENRADWFQDDVDDNVEMVRDLQVYFELLGGVPSRADFSALAARQIGPHVGLRAVLWVAVTQDGLQGPRLTVNHVEPPRESASFATLALASDPRRNEALEAARDNGALTTVPAPDAAGSAEDKFSMLVVAPVYRHRHPDTVAERRAELTGYVVAALSLKSLIEARPSEDAAARGVDEYFFDGPRADPSASIHIHKSSLRSGSSEPPAFGDTAHDPRWVHTISFPDRTLTIAAVATSDLHFFDPQIEDVVTLLTGIVITGLLVQYLFLSLRRRRQLALEIDERKRAEAALRESQQIVEGILDAAPVRIFWKDKNLIYLGCNAAFARDAGFAGRDDVIGKDDYQMGWRDQAELYRGDDRQVIESGRSRLLIEEPQTTPEGKIITLLTSKIPLRGPNGEIKGILGTYMDVTERKEAAKQLELHGAIAHAISRSVAGLLAAPSFAEGMSHALQIIGEALEVDRVLVLENTAVAGAAPSVSLCYEWQAPDIPVRVERSFFSGPEANSADIAAWYAPLAENKHVVTSSRTARGGLAKIFEALRIKSVLLMPIHADGKLWGNIGIDACRSERVWTQVEIDALRTLAEVIGTSIVRERHVSQLADADKIIGSSATVLYRLKGAPGFPLIFVSGNVSWFGYTAAQLLDDPTLYQKIIHPDDLPRLVELMESALRGSTVGGLLEYRLRKGDSYCWVESRFRPILNADGSLKEFEGILADITERKRVEEQLIQSVRQDNLTGLANRHVLVEVAQHAIARAHRGELGFAVLYLDLDHFKDVNDTLGHPIGDLLLVEVANRLRSSVRETDIVARFGGDEFAVLQAEVKDPADAATLATKLLAVISKPYSIGGNVIHIGTSIGIAVYGDDSADAESLLSHADVALYRVKAEGRGSYRFFTETMDAEVKSRFALAAELRDAIDRDQLYLLYQPQVEIATGRIIGLEALVRWHHPRLGLLPPPDFIEAAEKSGLIGALGQFVLGDACRQIKKWVDAGIAPAITAVNVSSIQFKAPLELEKKISTILEETGLPPRFLELELTETAIMEASLDNNDVLQRLQKRGIKLAIDDFGTGYSSLSYLRRFPVDLIKIAQNFVKDVLTDPGAAAIVKATIGLAHELKLDVIAEGVETVEQLHLLNSWGCGAAQGFYFAHPMTVEQIEPLLRQGAIFVPRPERLAAAS